ncbi:hypothetical protein BGX27_003927, partial [Mortierella sp. AM989]
KGNKQRINHDAAAFKESDLCRYEGEFFSEDDYLLAGAAYALSKTMIPCYKGATLTWQQKRFNKQHAKARAKIEHAFGMLKGKFRSLIELRCNIVDDASIQEAATTIIACVVLHNITRLPELYDPADEEIELVEMQRLPNNDIGGQHVAINKRDGIMREVLQRMDQFS